MADLWDYIEGWVLSHKRDGPTPPDDYQSEIQ